MASEERIPSRLELLALRAAQVQAWSQNVRDEMVRVAEEVASTEERLAATLGRMAEQQPQHAARLKAKSEAARKHAEYDRQWVKTHSS